MNVLLTLILNEDGSCAIVREYWPSIVKQYLPKFGYNEFTSSPETLDILYSDVVWKKVILAILSALKAIFSFVK